MGYDVRAADRVAHRRAACGYEVPMLSRGKLVQDWRRQLSSAEDGVQGEHRLRWLYKMRARLYRFLLSCYGRTDWRADEPSSEALDETLADVAHGDTTTLVDVPLDGKPPKHIGTMRAVLKSVSAAQDHPPEAGPLLQGIAKDGWVVVVSPRDKLQMHACEGLLNGVGIATDWGVQGELTVRLFDLDKAAGLIRLYRPKLRVKIDRVSLPFSCSQAPLSHPVASWPIRLAILAFLAGPMLAIWGTLFLQLFLTIVERPLLDKEGIGLWLGGLYVAIVVFGSLMKLLQDYERKEQERRNARRLVKEEGIADNRPDDKASP